MTILKGLAPAKINLTLHVTGQRSDGYHLLDSLVIFADVGDHLTMTPASDIELSVSGPFAEGVPTDHSNIVVKAAEALRARHGLTEGVAITLEKHLPNAAGIGGGSSDAAITLSMLAQLWGVDEPSPTDPLAAELGADVPVCMRAPSPIRMSGIGEVLEEVPSLPDFALVLLNPKVAVPTGPVFQALPSKSNPAMAQIPVGLSLAAFAAWLGSQRNDLQRPACKLAPEITRALAKLSAHPSVINTGMSGSGATCFGIVKDMGAARQVARAIQISEMNWWVTPAQFLK